jgi:ketosteroid isomerase-like protein
MSDTIVSTETAVHEAHGAYVDAINSNDTVQFLLTVTDDIVFIPPNSEPIVGKPAVGAWVDGYFHAVSTVWTKTTTELVVQDDLAYEWYRFRAVDTPREGGEPTVDTGNGVNIYRLDTDGNWRVWRDIWAADH